MAETKKITAQEIRSRILSAKDAKTEKLEIEEWNVTVWIHSLKYGERNRLLLKSGLGTKTTGELDVDQINNFIMSLVVATTRDEDGNKVFTKDDIKELETRNSETIDRIATIATRLSGLGAEGRAQIKGRFQRG